MGNLRSGDEFAELFPHLRGRLTASFVAAFGPVAGRATAADVLTFARHHWVTIRHRHDLVVHLFRLGRRMASRHPILFADDPVSQVMASLPVDERLALVLKRGLGWSFDEITEVTGLSVAALHRNHDHGLAKLTAGVGDLDAA
jgi:DNA-directed RNA polymerase specialized sigma24 family protein